MLAINPEAPDARAHPKNPTPRDTVEMLGQAGAIMELGEANPDVGGPGWLVLSGEVAPKGGELTSSESAFIAAVLRLLVLRASRDREAVPEID